MSANFEKHWDSRKVEQNEVGFCEDPILFYTDGLGPCIGVCIAWKSWGGILHSADIFMDEEDVVGELIETAKKVIPKSILPDIHPLVCGGDIQDPFGLSDNPQQDTKRILKARARTIQILKNAGFGKPHVLWSDGETAAVVADLKNSTMYIEQDRKVVGKWPILQ
jgi:hypothetical protein